MKENNLEQRLIDFAVNIIKIVDSLKNSKAGNHLGGQLVRSGTSPALNYGEAQSAESSRDFIHKLKVVLKELRETIICLKIIKKSELCSESQFLESTKNECDELISIFVASINTANKNKLK